MGTIQVVLTSETSGEITEIRFASGDRVSAGELLVVLNDKEERAGRCNQAAAFDLSEILFERDQTLIESKTIPQTQFDRSRADLERARAQLAETEARQALFAAPSASAGWMWAITSPPGTIVATLRDHSELEIDFTVSARYSPTLRAGLQVSVKVDAYPDRTFGASITAVDARVDPNTRNVLLRAAT